MASIEDFIIKQGGQKTDFKNLYMPKIDKYAKRTIRILEEPKSDMVKKFTFVHSYLPGIGNSACNNTADNIKAGKPCKFCLEFMNQMNQVEKEQFDWLSSLDIVNKEETDKFNNDILKVSREENAKPKLIFKNGKVFEQGKTFDKEISSLLSESEKKIYNSFYEKHQKVSGKTRKCKFFVPVFDYATDEVKIFEFGSAIWNKLDEVFTKAGYNYTSADITITHNAQLGNWWLVSKKDSAPISNVIVDKYNATKEEIKKELDRRTSIPTPEQQELLFKKYLDAVAKKNGEASSEEQEQAVVETKQQPKQESSVDLENLF